MATNDHIPQRRRVMVTGIGAVTPVGNTALDTWHALKEGKSGVTSVTSFNAGKLPTRIAAMVKDFDHSRVISHREARRTALFVQFALTAAMEAVSQAGLDLEREDPTRLGVEIGSALGGAGLIEDQSLILEQNGTRAINPTLIPAIIINAAACTVAIRLGFQGPVNAPVAACATGSVALGDAARRLAWGEADLIIAGGAESVITPLGITAFSRLGALSTRNESPEQACAPFDAYRDGAVVGEGAAIMVLETLEHALQRGASILAELVGFGYTCDAYHIAAPEPSGSGAARAIAKALAEAELSGEQLSWICAHGTATQLNDAAETRAIKIVLGETAYRVPISSIKGAVGHTLGAAGAISAVIGVQAIQQGFIPPTLNYRVPDPECDLDYVPNQGRKAEVEAVLVNSFGIGGQNACLALRKYP
jgi:3-oxoacyl-[acyl-carrier-protein] synthase II